MATDITPPHHDVHLVILHHGMWGNVAHLRFIAEQFKQRLGDRVLVYRAQANESGLTYDGVDVCGQRLVQEIYNVIKVIEDGGNIEEMKGQRLEGNKKKNKEHPEPAPAATATARIDLQTIDQDSATVDLAESLDAATLASRPKVTQFSFLGYSLGGVIGRFALGMLDLEGFFNPLEEGGRGIEPIYFVTIATPHLGVRNPHSTTFSKVFNYVSSRMLSRAGEQMQLVDNYIGGKPVFLVMSEPSSIFMHALARFKTRALYCNIQNDRTVPFWSGSFSGADPFHDLESMEIQYDSEYPSLIESFEYQDPKVVAQRKQEYAEASFADRVMRRVKVIPWKTYAVVGLLGPILIPIWLVIALVTVSIQGSNSRRRTKPILESNTDLHRVRNGTASTRIRTSGYDSDQSCQSDSVLRVQGDQAEQDQQHQIQKQENPSTASVVHIQPPSPNTQTDSSVTLTVPLDASDTNIHSSRTSHGAGDKESIAPSTSVTMLMAEAVGDSEPTSNSYPHLKKVRQLVLMPAQIEISKNLNKLEWRKNMIHIEARNAHASIVVREKLSFHEGGIAAVQHAVDMFKGDDEDE